MKGLFFTTTTALLGAAITTTTDATMPDGAMLGAGLRASGNVKNTINYYLRAGDNAPHLGIDSLGAGYDIIFGNPSGDPDTQVDPGFRAPVIEMDWSQSFTSRDTRFLQPIGGYSVPVQTCYMNQKATETSTSEEYESNLETQCSITGGGGFGPVSGSFTASAGYSSFASDIASSSKKQYTITSYCLVGKAGLSTDFKHEFQATEGLKTAIAAVKVAMAESEPQKCDWAPEAKYCAWFKLFENYGTHFTNEVELGGKMIYESTISEESVESARSQGLDLGAEVEASYMAFSGGASASMSSSSSSKNSKSSMDMEIKIKVFGGNPPPSGAGTEEGFSEWATTVQEKPMAVRYKLSYIYELSAFADIQDEARAAVFAYYTHHKVDPLIAQPVGGKISSLGKSYMVAGMELKSGEKMISDDGSVELRLQDDGNLILSNNKHQLWATNVYPGFAYSPYKLKVQNDGNMVVYDRGGKAIWSSGTFQCPNHCLVDKMTVQNDGNVVLYSVSKEPMWHTHTHGPRENHNSGGSKGGCCA